ncbi:PQQ-dependent sugar dehydrogenase [Methanoculleus sp.]|uniref:PQQ-dependent sugar dehydrogenase n=1 Tax=Methanoculleus sp. TaxID=90427 RepID=UPI002FC63DF4
MKYAPEHLVLAAVLALLCILPAGVLAQADGAVQVNGSEYRIYAEGLRNTIGFGWHPETGKFWGIDQGSDWRGPDLPPKKLNRIEDGGNYGWPWRCGKQQIDRIIAQDPPNMTREEFCAISVPSVLEYQAHSPPMQFVFYNETQLPKEDQNDAFLALRGSWNRCPPIGYKVVRVLFDDAGEPEGFEDFMTGFLHENETAFSTRLCGLAIAEDGSLLVGDDTNGVIYRISYMGEENTTGGNATGGHASRNLRSNRQGAGQQGEAPERTPGFPCCDGGEPVRLTQPPPGARRRTPLLPPGGPVCGPRPRSCRRSAR